MRPGEVVLTEQSEAELANLRRALGRETGFSLYVVLAEGPARAEVLARLRAWSGRDGIPELTFLPGGKDAGGAVMDLVNGKGAPVAGVVIPDGDSVVRDETALASLNTARDRLYEWIEGPLLIVLAPRNEVVLSRVAPDFFDVRAGTYTIVAEREPPRPAHEVFLLHELEARGGPVREEAELRALEALEDPPLPSALADAWLNLATSRWENRDWTGAEGAAAEVVRFARPIHYWGAIAPAARMIAFGLRQAGRLQEAEGAAAEALDAATRVGNARQAAMAKGVLAYIRQERGDIDEAVRICREEVLPALERLGATRALLGGRAQLALALFARGHFEQDGLEIVTLLALALKDARRLRLPEASDIAAWVRQLDLDPDAPPFV